MVAGARERGLNRVLERFVSGLGFNFIRIGKLAPLLKAWRANSSADIR
jgi:hypothetical protein